MMITMLATLCHMATVSPGMTAVEFCQEQIVAQQDQEPTRENIAACFAAAQMTIASMLPRGYTVHEIRCASDRDGGDKPRDAI